MTTCHLMLARKECRDFVAVVKIINAPRSNFEQFYGLRLGRAMVPDLDTFERQLLAQAIDRAQRKRRFRHDPPLMHLGEGILSELGRARSPS